MSSAETGLPLDDQAIPFPSTATLQEMAVQATVSSTSPCLIVFVVDKSPGDLSVLAQHDACERICISLAEAIG